MDANLSEVEQFRQTLGKYGLGGSTDALLKAIRASYLAAGRVAPELPARQAEVLQQLGYGWPGLSERGKAIGRELVDVNLRESEGALREIASRYPAGIIALFLRAASQGGDVYSLRIPDEPIDFNGARSISLTDLVRHRKIFPHVTRLGSDLAQQQLAVEHKDLAYKGAKYVAVFIHLAASAAKKLEAIIDMAALNEAEDDTQVFNLLGQYVLPPLSEFDRDGISRQILGERMKHAVSEGITTNLVDEGPAFLVLDRNRYQTAVLQPILDGIVESLMRQESAARENEPDKPRTAHQSSTRVDEAKVGTKGTSTSQPNSDRLSILLGRSPEGQDVWWQPSRSNNGHMVIVGGSGAGKTELIRCIAAELVAKRFPVLMIDFHGDMAPGQVDGLRTYNIREGSPYFFNPLDLDRRFPEITPLRATSDFLDAMAINFPGLGIQQRDRLAQIIDDAYGNVGITSDPATWSSQLSFGDIQNAILDTDDKETLTLKAYFREIFGYSLFSGEEKLSAGEVLSSGTTISHVNLKLLPENLRSLYADLFLRKLYYLLQTRGEIPRENIDDMQRFRIFVIVDEAKLLVSERQGFKAVLNKYATEMRKFGVGLVLASQLISHFNDEILANIAAKICMNAENKEQARANGKLFGIAEEVLMNLRPGQCYLKTGDGQTELQVVPSWKR